MEATKDQALGAWYRQEGKVGILNSFMLVFLLFSAAAVLQCSLTCVGACCRQSASARLAISFIILLLTLGVIGVGTWGLTDSIKNTDHQVDQAWGIVSNASSTVRIAVC